MEDEELDLVAGDISTDEKPDPFGFAPWQKFWESDRLQRQIVTFKERKLEKGISQQITIPSQIKISDERILSKQAVRRLEGESPEILHKIPSMTSLNTSINKPDKIFLIRKKGGLSLEKNRGKLQVEKSLRLSATQKIEEASCPVIVAAGSIKKFYIQSFQDVPPTVTQTKFDRNRAPAKRMYHQRRMLTTVGIEPALIEKVTWWIENSALQKREIYRKLQMRKYFGSELSTDQKQQNRHYLFFYANDHASASTTDDPLCQDILGKTVGDFRRGKNPVSTDQPKKFESFNVRDKFSVAHCVYNPTVKKNRGKEKPPSVGLDFKNVKGTPFGSILENAIKLEQSYNYDLVGAGKTQLMIKGKNSRLVKDSRFSETLSSKFLHKQ